MQSIETSFSLALLVLHSCPQEYIQLHGLIKAHFSQWFCQNLSDITLLGGGGENMTYHPVLLYRCIS